MAGLLKGDVSATPLFRLLLDQHPTCVLQDTFDSSHLSCPRQLLKHTLPGWRRSGVTSSLRCNHQPLSPPGTVETLSCLELHRHRHSRTCPLQVQINLFQSLKEIRKGLGKQYEVLTV